jgi:hypothetical protein
MKRLHFALVTVAAFALCACSTTGPQTATATSSPSASPAATAASTAEMERAIIDLEKKGWELYKNKQAKEFRSLQAPGYRTVGSSGMKNADEDIKEMEATDIKSYSLSDMNVEFPSKDAATVTYKATYEAIYRGKPVGGVFNSSGVWVNIGGEWKAALYHETKAEPQPKK